MRKSVSKRPEGLYTFVNLRKFEERVLTRCESFMQVSVRYICTIITIRERDGIYYMHERVLIIAIISNACILLYLGVNAIYKYLQILYKSIEL